MVIWKWLTPFPMTELISDHITYQVGPTSWLPMVDPIANPRTDLQDSRTDPIPDKNCNVFRHTSVSSTYRSYPGQSVRKSVRLSSIPLSDFHSVSVHETTESVETSLWWPTWWLIWRPTWRCTWWPIWRSTRWPTWRPTCRWERWF